MMSFFRLIGRFFQRQFSRVRRALRKRFILIIGLLIISAALVDWVTRITTAYPDGSSAWYKVVVWWAVNVLSFIIGLLCGVLCERRPRSVLHPEADEGTIDEGSLTATLLEVFWNHRIEILIFGAVAFLAAFLMAFFNESLSKRYGELTLSFVLTLVGLMLTVAGMYYAFQAERKSDRLLHSTALFLPRFSGFINRVGRKLAELKVDVYSPQEAEKNCYIVKCMFLTPFLGHAGLRKSDDEMYYAFDRCKTYVRDLVKSGRCQVQILTLNSDSLVSWYAHIQWIDIAHEEYLKKGSANISDCHDLAIKDKVKAELPDQKGNKALATKGGSAPAFCTLRDEYASWLDNPKDPRLQIGVLKRLPFQCLLVSRLEVVDLKRVPSDDAFERKDGDLFENELYCVLTFVGSDTYRIVRLNTKDPNTKSHPLGIPGLLDELHAAAYSEDQRFCRIVNNHFKTLWGHSIRDKAYPVIPDNDWSEPNKHSFGNGL